MNIQNMRIGARLVLGFGLVLALMVLMTATGVWRLQDIGAATESMVRQDLVKERLATEWVGLIEGNGVRGAALIKSQDAEDQRFFKNQMAAQSGRASEIQKLMEASVSGEGRQLLDELLERRKTYTLLRNEAIKLKDAGDEVGANAALDSQLVPAMRAYVEQARALERYHRELIDATATRIDSDYRSGRIVLLAIGLAALLLGLLSAWRLALGITRPLARAVAAAQAVAAGNLTGQIVVDGKDEIGQLLQALKEMTQSLLATVGEVRSGADTIAIASAQIAGGNQDLSLRTEQQASSLQQTASAMEQLTSTVQQNADNARQAKQLAVAASETAIAGGAMVDRVVSTMGEINQSSTRIVDIISVIDGIAFQTNILALNAAVEAARAGEQGRGFAVVASEVRSLAQRSAAAAKEIKTLIDDSVSKVGSGSQLVEQTGATMRELVASVRRVTDIVGEISAASQEQSTGIGEVGHAITQMDQVTQQNAALVEQSAAAAGSLQQQANRLAEVVGVFNIGGAAR